MTLSTSYNQLNHLRGHLWRERYQAVTIEEISNEWNAMAYTALNKRKAGMITVLDNDTSSSWAAYVHGVDDGITTLCQDYMELGDTPEERQEAFRDMVETMYGAPGIGLAANQVGVSLRVCIVDLSVGEDPDGLRVFINPVVRETSGSQLGEEGCLSFPDITLEIEFAIKCGVVGNQRIFGGHSDRFAGILH